MSLPKILIVSLDMTDGCRVYGIKDNLEELNLQLASQFSSQREFANNLLGDYLYQVPISELLTILEINGYKFIRTMNCQSFVSSQYSKISELNIYMKN